MDWNMLEAKISSLADKVIYKPDIIIGIVRGGVVPARMLASKLGIDSMYCISVKKMGDARKVVTTIDENLLGQSILLVEDVLESGTSLIAAKDYLEAKGATVKSAALYIQPQSQIKPDYFLDTVDSAPRFPWE